MNKIAHTTIRPTRNLNLLSQQEILQLSSPSADLHRLFRNCALAILNTDSREDDAEQIFSKYHDFDIRLLPQPRGVMLEIHNAPGQSFVDGVNITTLIPGMCA